MKKKQLVLDACFNILTSLHLVEDIIYGHEFDEADKQLAGELAPLRARLGQAREKYKIEKGEIVRVPAIKENAYEFGAKRFPGDD